MCICHVNLVCLSVCVQFTNVKVNWRNNTWSSRCEWFPRWCVYMCVCEHVCVCCRRPVGKSAPVWRDSLCTDCAFDCLICVKSSCWFDRAFVSMVAEIQFGFPPAQPTGTDMKVLSGCFIQQAAFSVSLFSFFFGCLYLAASVRFPIDSKVYSCTYVLSLSPSYSRELFQATHPQLNLSPKRKQNVPDLADSWSNLFLQHFFASNSKRFSIILQIASFQTALKACLDFRACS